MIFNDPNSPLDGYTILVLWLYPNFLSCPWRLILPTYRSSALCGPGVGNWPVRLISFLELFCSLVFFNISLLLLPLVLKEYKSRKGYDFEIPCLSGEVFECFNLTHYIECLLSGVFSWKSLTIITICSSHKEIWIPGDSPTQILRDELSLASPSESTLLDKQGGSEARWR